MAGRIQLSDLCCDDILDLRLVIAQGASRQPAPGLQQPANVLQGYLGQVLALEDRRDVAPELLVGGQGRGLRSRIARGAGHGGGGGGPLPRKGGGARSARAAGGALGAG